VNNRQQRRALVAAGVALGSGAVALAAAALLFVPERG
jgi:hypothetical protein